MNLVRYPLHETFFSRHNQRERGEKRENRLLESSRALESIASPSVCVRVIMCLLLCACPPGRCGENAEGKLFSSVCLGRKQKILHQIFCTNLLSGQARIFFSRTRRYSLTPQLKKPSSNNFSGIRRYSLTPPLKNRATKKPKKT